MLTSKAQPFAKATTKLGLATTVAVLWMAAVPFAGATAAETGYPISNAPCPVYDGYPDCHPDGRAPWPVYSRSAPWTVHSRSRRPHR